MFCVQPLNVCRGTKSDPALSVTITVAGAVGCPLQRGEVVFIVTLRAGGGRNRVPQLKGVTAVIITITQLATGCLSSQKPLNRCFGLNMV
jgi:hypothetical protein